MYLSDSDLEQAIENGQLIVRPPTKVDPTSIDLHLDSVDQAKVWDVSKIENENAEMGHRPRELHVGRMTYGKVSRKYLVPPPMEQNADDTSQVFKRHDCVVMRPGGFLLWQTREIVGTPEENPLFICFIDGKSTRARTGLVVHLTAPTIHSGWSGNITLELANLGPLDLVLHEGDAVAQIVVAQISQPPHNSMREAGSKTIGQTSVTGSGNIPKV